MARGRNNANATAEGPSHGPHRPDHRSQSEPSDCMALIQNKANFEKSTAPARVMHYRDGGCVDFPADVADTLKGAFVSRIPIIAVKIDGSDFLIDFLRMLEFDLNATRRKSIAWIDVNGNCFFPKVLIGEESGSDPSSPRMQKVDDVAKGSNPAGPSEPRSEARANPGEGFEIGVRLPDSDRIGGAVVGGGSINTEPANGNGVTAPGNADGGPVGPTAPGEAENTSLRRRGVERLTSVKRRARMGSAAPRAADPSPVNRQVEREVAAPRKARGKSVNRRASKGKKVDAVPAAPGPKVNEAGDGNFVNTGRRNAADRGKQPLEVDPSKKDRGDGRIGRGESVSECGPLGEKRVPECGPSGEKPALESGSLSRLAMEWDMVPTPGKPSFDSMAGKLVRLSELHKSYVAVKNMLRAGMRIVNKRVRVCSIYSLSHAGPTGSARLQGFERSAEMMQANRGNSNVRYAWHGAAPKTIESIILHGFGQVEAREGLEAYGIGIYLSAEGKSYASASRAGPDEDGMCYMVLCRVIMGNMEEILAGSRQFLPSNEQFDSGVDSLRDTTHYIVWSINMNTHILPEYVVGKIRLHDLVRTIRLPPGDELLVATVNSMLDRLFPQWREMIDVLGCSSGGEAENSREEVLMYVLEANEWLPDLKFNFVTVGCLQ